MLVNSSSKFKLCACSLRVHPDTTTLARSASPPLPARDEWVEGRGEGFFSAVWSISWGPPAHESLHDCTENASSPNPLLQRRRGRVQQDLFRLSSPVSGFCNLRASINLRACSCNVSPISSGWWRSCLC